MSYDPHAQKIINDNRYVCDCEEMVGWLIYAPFTEHSEVTCPECHKEVELYNGF